MNFKKINFLIALALCLSLAGCGEKKASPSVEYPLTIQNIVIQKKPKFVASLSPGTTEMLRQLDLGGRLVAISDYCTNPLSPDDKEYFRYRLSGSPQLPNVEEISKSGAEVLFTIAELSSSQLTEFQQRDITVVVLPHAKSLDGLRENYRTIFKVMLGDYTGGIAADEFLARFDQKYSAMATYGGEAMASTPQTAVYIAADYLTLATGDSIEGQILQVLGLENLGDGHSGYLFPQELAKELDPDIIFYNGILSKEQITTADVYKTTKAVKSGAVYYVSSTEFEMQTPDILRTMWRMGEILYPNTFIKPAPKPDYESVESAEVTPKSNETTQG